MANKYTQTSDEVVDFIETIINEKTSLAYKIEWKILTDEKQKELIKIVKTSSVTEYFAKMYDSIIIFVNEEIFDRMEPNSANDVDYRALVIEDALVNVQIIENENTGNMSIKIAKPNICITSDGYAKYGEDLAHAAEVAALAYSQIQEEIKKAKEAEKEKKAAEKAAKKGNHNANIF